MFLIAQLLDALVVGELDGIWNLGNSVQNGGNVDVAFAHVQTCVTGNVDHALPGGRNLGGASQRWAK